MTRRDRVCVQQQHVIHLAPEFHPTGGSEMGRRFAQVGQVGIGDGLRFRLVSGLHRQVVRPGQEPLRVVDRDVSVRVAPALEGTRHRVAHSPIVTLVQHRVAEPAERCSDDLAHRFVASRHVRQPFVGRRPVEILVRGGVVAQFHAGVQPLPEEGRAVPDPTAGHESGGRDTPRREGREQGIGQSRDLGVRVAGSIPRKVVERDRDPGTGPGRGFVQGLREPHL